MIEAFLAGVGAIVVLAIVVIVSAYLAAVEEQVDRIREGLFDPRSWDVLPLARWWTTGEW